MTDIVNTSTQNNKLHGISGFIMFKGSTCFQYIEGYREDLSQLIQNIKADERVDDYTTIIQGSLETRISPEGWYMKELVDEDFNQRFDQVYNKIKKQMKDYLV